MQLTVKIDIFSNFQATTFQEVLRWLADTSNVHFLASDVQYCRSFEEVPYFASPEASVLCILVDWTPFRSGEEITKTIEAIESGINVLRQINPVAEIIVYSFPLHASLINSCESLRHEAQTRLLEEHRVKVRDMVQCASAGAVSALFATGVASTGCPFTTELITAGAVDLVRCFWQRQHSVFKLIIADCDDTLWDGNASEGDCLSVSDPHLQVQHFLKHSRLNGALLAVCSKSQVSDIIHSLDSTPGVITHSEDFSGYMCGISSKSRAVAELCETLGVSFFDTLVIDNDMRECAEIEMSLDGVVCICIGQDSPRLLNALSRGWLWGFDKTSVETGVESRKRWTDAQIARDRAISGAVYCDIQSLLELVPTLLPLEEKHLGRVVELSHRARQWSCVPEALTEVFLRSYIEQQQRKGWILEATDRFGDYGLVGFLLYSEHQEELVVEQMALSCRILHKGLEGYLLGRASADALSRGLQTIAVQFRETSRNVRLRSWLEDVFVEATEWGFRSYLGKQLINQLTRPYASGRSADGNGMLVHRDHGRADVGSTTNGNTESKRGWVRRQCDDLTSAADVYRSMLRDGSSGAQPVVDKNWTAVEIQIYRDWIASGGPPNIQKTDDLFEVVRDSLFAISFVSAIDSRFNIRIPAFSIFESTFSIEELAALVECIMLVKAPRNELLSALSEMS